MKVKEILKELYKCNELNCQGCKLNIKVLHGFDCAAHLFNIDNWKDKLSKVLNPRYSKYNAFLEAIELHEKNKEDCRLCPLYDETYNKCELKRFQDRQTILRTMNKEEELDNADIVKRDCSESSGTNLPE